jgi:hypothetical protein
MLSTLNRDHHLTIVNTADIYSAVRFSATCKTIHTATKVIVAARQEILLKNVAVRLTTDFQERFRAFPDLAPTLEVGIGRILKWNQQLERGIDTGKVVHNLHLVKPDSTRLLLTQYNIHAHDITVFLYVSLTPNQQAQVHEFMFMYMTIKPSTDAEGSIVIDGTQTSTYANGVNAFLRERGYI